MAEIYGLSGRDLAAHVGSLRQVVSAELFHDADGRGAGTRRVRLVNGGGLELELQPDRALDIGRVTYRGVPFAWLSWAGGVSGDRYEPSGGGWLRTFGGGLLATCGLDAFGAPSSDDGQEFGQHGRIGASPATITTLQANDDEVVVAGSVTQGCLFAENIRLERRISSPAGSNVLVIDDEIINDGFADQPHMMLYHMNFGWPLVDEGTRLVVDGDVGGYNERSKAADARWEVMDAPTPGFDEQVFRADLRPGGQGAVVTNEARGLSVRVSVDDSLPHLFIWKMAGQGAYVWGVEPTNCPEMSRGPAHSAGVVPVLAPGESARHRVRLEFEAGTDV